jgi:superfamily I DNA/RNA helicase
MGTMPADPRRALPAPRGRQADVVFMRPQGAMVVLGTAGSGKSLMALHRAARVANPETTGHGPTLLITFNRALVGYLDNWAGGLPNVTVRHYSSWARDIAVRAGSLPGYTLFAQYQDRDHLIDVGVEAARQRFDGATVLAREIRFFADEFDWIAGMGCASELEYQAAERVGRGDGVNRGEPRRAVWAAYTAYRAVLARSRFDEDWAGLTNLAVAGLRNGAVTSAFRHVVVDEAQDLSPQALRALSMLVPNEGSLTLFADYAQQLYGGRLSWRQVGIERPTIERFTENYRNSTAIAEFAIAMSGQGYFRDTEDLVIPTAQVSPGDKPVIVTCRDVDEQQYVAQRALEFARTQRVGIIVKTHEEMHQLRARLGSVATEFHGGSTNWLHEPGVTLTTYHSAKGVEFGTVILPALTEARFPDPELVEAFGEQEAIARQARLLYVGITRARSNLILTHTEPLTRLLPPETPNLTSSVTR